MVSPGFGSEARYEWPELETDCSTPILILNSQYRYTGHDMLTFSTAELLSAVYPGILPLRAAIDSWASRVGIHPRVFSALVSAYFEGSLVRGDRLDKNAAARLAGAMFI